MSKPTPTELQWQIDALERKVAALADLVVFMTGHLGSTSPEGAAHLIQQLRELRQIEGVGFDPAFQELSSRIESALEPDQPMDLDSIRLIPDPE